MYLISSLSVIFSKIPLSSIENTNNNDFTQYEIQKGDSLWSIADQFNSKNKEIFIYKIKKINKLDNSSLVVNDILLIPLNI
tara:strand:- start:954 stop:1196 length:243 start_codon:yes stop_codon:yes gene_type:complete